MILHVVVLILLVFGAIDSESRSIDIEENNSIEPSMVGARRSLLDKDWIKLTKAPPSKIMQLPGKAVEIACEVMGSQVPTIQWIEGHPSLYDIDDLESNVVDESSSSALVRVRSVHIVEHMLSEKHTYTCIGRTGSKTVYASTVVYPATGFNSLMQVHEAPLLSRHRPVIIYNEKVHLDLVGSNILLPCKVHARPSAEVYWMNGDGQVIEQNRRFKFLPSGELLISDIQWEDMGVYRCIARNSVGKDSADAFVYPVLKEENAV